MDNNEKEIAYTTKNTYSTLNDIGPKTKNIWIVFHGIGFLSRYFIKYFDTLDPDENYIIAPQAPSKYYLNGEYKHVGASWLTKEKTSDELNNVLNYIDAVIQNEELTDEFNLIVFGFSQGVSIAARWVAKRKVKCSQLVLYAGGIPHELEATDFEFLQKNNTKVSVIIGDKDEYLTPERMKLENKRIDTLFQGNANTIIFEGRHEMRKDLINNLIR